MIFDWYRIFSLSEFLATNLISRELTVVLESVGEKSILITSGNVVSVLYEDTFMPIEFNQENPYVRAGDDGTYAVYRDADDFIWLGIEVPPQ